MQHIRLLCLVIFSLYSAFSLAYASDEGIPYHCPSVADIQFNRYGSFGATTEYNGTHVEWYSTRSFYRPDQSNLRFESARGTSDCLGNTCEIDCLYSLKPDSYFHLFVRYQLYRFLDPVSSSWENRVCRSDSAAACEFFIIKDSWW